MEEKENNIAVDSTNAEGLFEKTLKSFEDAGMNFGDIQELSSLLAMPDEEFDKIKPYILMELEKSLNNVNDKLILAQSFNAAGVKTEDVAEVFEEFIKQIDEQMTSISQNKRDFLKRMISMLLNAISDVDGVSKRQVRIPIQLIHESAKMPTYANETDAGMDIYALEDIIINPGETKIIHTGLKMAIPFGYEIQVRPKSGRAAKTKMRVANSPGTIDSGYRDEIGVIIDNIEPPIKDIQYDFDPETHYPIITSILTGSPMYIGKGEKFAQLVLNEIPKAVFYEVEDISSIEGNRGGGFGSTGLK